MSVASLRKWVTKAPFVLAVAALGLVVVGSGCTTAVKELRGYEGEEAVRVMLGAQSAGAGPFLSLGKEPGGAPSYSPAEASAQSGLQQMQNAVNGAAGQSFEFKLAKPLEQDYFLNLSKPVSGVIHWSTAVTQNAGGLYTAEASTDVIRVRGEVWAGNKRVGGGEWGGSHAIGGDGSKWQRLVLYFRPEVEKLSAGETLTVKVFRSGGLADFAIGTGAPQQSYVEFRYFDFDPLSGAVYLENGKIYFDPEATTDEKRSAFSARIEAMRLRGELDHYPPGAVVRVPAPDEGADAPRAVAFGIVGLLPAAAILMARPTVPRRRSSIAVALTLLFLLAAMSGCAASKAKALPTVINKELSTTIVEDATLVGVGAVSGTVRDGEIKLAVPNAHISFLGTNLFMSTDKRGNFAFNNVSAGTYKMRVDAQKFNSLEQNVRVEVGKRTVLAINLTHALGVKERAHSHAEHWGDGIAYRVLDAGSFLPRQSADTLVETSSLIAPDKYQCASWECVAEVKVPMEKVVPPGTGRVEVTVDWDAGGDAPKQAALRIVTSGNGTLSDFVARGPKDPFQINVFPIEADAGHQTFTQWRFMVHMRPSPDFYNVATKPILQGGAIKVTITAYRTIIPLEPAHRDFWAGQSELPVITDLVGKSVSAGTKYPVDSDTYRWVPGKGMFVPPGTLEIKGRVTIQGTGTPLGKFRLGYTGADVQPSRSLEAIKYATVDEASRSATGFTFTIPVKGQEVDEFYQTKSFWKFFIDDSEDYAGYGLASAGNGLKLFLDAKAYKDPNYTF